MTEHHGIVTPGRTFRARAASAVRDPQLQRALRNLDRRYRTAGEAAARQPERREQAARVRRETLPDLDAWLDRLDAALVAAGAVVHRADTPSSARAIVQAIVAEAMPDRPARIVKSKSMATEEIELGAALEEAGHDVLESDLGEYIVQVAGERPSHMITPAIHKTLDQIQGVLSTVAAGDAVPSDRDGLTSWAREHLRPRLLAADVGITGVNFAAADTGTLVLVTNEGNGRYCTAWPRVQIAVMPVEKVVARLADVGDLVPLLTSHATGQRLTTYVTMMTGPRRGDEIDGPEALHVVFVDHNRRRLVGTPYEEMLACIRCGACLNVCPVYRTTSGHAYDTTYTGPMGKVLTPLLDLGATGSDLPFASTLCGACTEACPVGIPLADLLVHLRSDLRSSAPSFTGPLVDGEPPDATGLNRAAWRLWARAWSSERGYRATTGTARRVVRMLGRRWTSRAPFPLVRGWTRGRDLPVPARRSCRDEWAAKRGGSR
jgi:L-lactate dehydrogenase complex protein LldF